MSVGRSLPLVLGLLMLAAGARGAEAIAPRLHLPQLGDVGDRSTRPTSRPLLSSRSLKLLGVLGTAALLTTDDRDPHRLARRLDGDGLFDGFIDIGGAFGDGGTFAALTAGSYLYGRWGDSDGAAALSADLTRSLLTTWAAVWILKVAVDAERPNGGRYSFPSGHTATAFAGTTVLRRHLGGKAGLAFGLLSVGTGLARMEDGKHHPADVLFGAALGLALGHEAITNHRGRFAFEGFTLSTRRIGVQFSF